jgi:hypothetical protein
MIIVTHTSPDMDAIGAVWLLQRFAGFDEANVAFVNTGNPDPSVTTAADAVVDTGRVYDPGNWRFDHHQLPGRAATDTCAARQVYFHLDDAADVGFIYPLVALIHAGDSGSAYAAQSRQLGIHALLSAYKAERHTDAEILEFGFSLLDRIAAGLRAQAEAREAIDRHRVYESGDGLIVALKDAPQDCSSAAIARGARLVLFQSGYELPDGTTTHAIGIQRGGEYQEPHVGDLVDAVMAVTHATVRAELVRWFCHPAGFFAGRGTQKAPCATPVEIDLAELAAKIDWAWVR